MRRVAKIAVTIPVAAAFALGVSACTTASAGNSAGGSSSASAVSGPSVTLTFEDYESTTNPITTSMDAFAKQVGQDTGGKVTIKVYPNAQLISETNAGSALTSDSVNMGFAGDDDFAELMPGVDVASAPGFITSWAEADKVSASAPVNAYLSKEFTTHRLHFLGLIPDGFSYVISKSPIADPAEMKGVKVRVPGTATAPDISALAGSPVTMALGDVFEGLEVNTISGALTTAPSFASEHLDQVAKYVDLIPINMAWYQLAMSAASWSQLSASEQAVVTKDAQSAVVAAGKLQQSDETTALSDLKSTGATIVEPTSVSAFTTLLNPLRSGDLDANATSKALGALEATAAGA